MIELADINLFAFLTATPIFLLYFLTIFLTS